VAEGIRTFVAVELDTAARRAVEQVLERLRVTGADVRWVPPESLHLTLKFLGNMSVQRVSEVEVALTESLSGQVRGFEFSLAGVGTFPSPASPRVVWVGVAAGAEELAVLADRVERTLEPLGFPREKRPFRPHLTLGRCRSTRGLDGLKRAIAAESSFSGPLVRVRRVVLFSSDLRPTGAVYRPLATFPLVEG